MTLFASSEQYARKPIHSLTYRERDRLRRAKTLPHVVPLMATSASRLTQAQERFTDTRAPVRASAAHRAHYYRQTRAALLVPRVPPRMHASRFRGDAHGAVAGEAAVRDAEAV